LEFVDSYGLDEYGHPESLLLFSCAKLRSDYKVHAFILN